MATSTFDTFIIYLLKLKKHWYEVADGCGRVADNNLDVKSGGIYGF